MSLNPNLSEKAVFYHLMVVIKFYFQTIKAKLFRPVKVLAMYIILTIPYSAVARPNGQPRQAGVARGVRGYAPPPEKF